MHGRAWLQSPIRYSDQNPDLDWCVQDRPVAAIFALALFVSRARTHFLPVIRRLAQWASENFCARSNRVTRFSVSNRGTTISYLIPHPSFYSWRNHCLRSLVVHIISYSTRISQGKKIFLYRGLDDVNFFLRAYIYLGNYIFNQKFDSIRISVVLSDLIKIWKKIKRIEDPESIDFA